MPDRTPTLALWLDSADDTLLRNWMAEGRLPTFQRLFQEGFSGTLANPCHSLAEIAQALLITGCPPETSRYWGVHHFDPQAYTVTHGGIYDYHTRPPFFAVGPPHRFAAIDLPQYHFHPAVHGWQVRNWGCHSAMTPTDSLPPEAISILDREAGIPPIRTHNFSNLKDAQDLKRLVDDLHQALDARARMLAFLIGQEGWDLVLTPFAELHKGGHYLVPNPDSLDILGRDDPWAPLAVSISTSTASSPACSNGRTAGTWPFSPSRACTPTPTNPTTLSSWGIFCCAIPSADAGPSSMRIPPADPPRKRVPASTTG